MVGGEYDHRIVRDPLFLDKGHEPSDLVIELLYQAHIGGQDTAPRGIVAERL